MPHSLPSRPALTALCLAIVMPIATGPVSSQQAAGRSHGIIAGMVVDAGTGAPLTGALVVLETVLDGAVLRPAGSGRFISRGITAVTGNDGVYRLTGLPPGPYRLYVRHLAYREAAVDLELSQSTFHLSVGLVVQPIRLQPVEVEMPGQSFGRTRTAIDEARFGRTDAEGMRQERFFESDARVLTQSDVTEAVTLGESDLLRAIQRLPGVSARDDYSAGVWTRGAPWGQTRAYYDGQPLFNPVHAFGLLSSLTPDAVGLASFHPGVRSASMGEGAAGVLWLTSRAADRAGVHGLGEISVASARAAVETASRDGTRGVVLSARRSYLDLATSLARLAGGDSALYVPYAFLDLSARADFRLDARTGLELSGLWTEDDIRGRLGSLLQPTRGYWGNQVARGTVEHGAGGVRSRTSLGVSRFQGLINPPAPKRRSATAAFADEASEPGMPPRVAPRHGSTRNQLTVITTATEIAQASGTRRPIWATGAQFTSYTQSFGGQLPRPYPVTVLPDTLLIDDALIVPAAWAERRWFASPSFAVETGLRVEFPSGVQNAPGVAASPRLTLRFTTPGGRATVSTGVARSWQYTQALAPAGPSVGPDLYLTDVWLLAGDTIPAIRSDIATLGGELSLGNAWVAGATGYYRRATGVAAPDPEPGVLSNQRPIFVPAVNDATGVELGLRRIVGWITASLSYTLARSMLRARGLRYPSSADRRHTVDATAMIRLTPGSRVGAALTAGSGSPYSRVILGARLDSLGQETTDTLAMSIGAPNGQRTPAYAAVDLLWDWEGTLGRARVGAFVQIRNVLNRSNAVTYTGSIQPCVQAPPTLVSVPSGACDRFDRGIPLLPLAGVRIAF